MLFFWWGWILLAVRPQTRTSIHHRVEQRWYHSNSGPVIAYYRVPNSLQADGQVSTGPWWSLLCILTCSASMSSCSSTQCVYASCLYKPSVFLPRKMGCTQNVFFSSQLRRRRTGSSSLDDVRSITFSEERANLLVNNCRKFENSQTALIVTNTSRVGRTPARQLISTSNDTCNDNRDGSNMRLIVSDGPLNRFISSIQRFVFT